MKRCTITLITLVLAVATQPLVAGKRPARPKPVKQKLIDSQLLEKSKPFNRSNSSKKFYSYKGPSIIATKNGAVVIFVQKRKGSLKKGQYNLPDFGHDSDGVIKVSTNGGKSWGTEIDVLSRKGVDVHSGPLLYDKKNNRIFAFGRYYKTSKDNAEGKKNKKTMSLKEQALARLGDYMSYSDDDGRSWSKAVPAKLPYPSDAHGAGVINGGHGIQLQNGRLVLPARFYSRKGAHSILFLSDDGGATWKRGAIIPVKGFTPGEYSLAETKPGEIYLNFRTGKYPGRVYARVGSNGGKLLVRKVQVNKKLPPAPAHCGVIRIPGSQPKLLLSLPDTRSLKDNEGSYKARHHLTIFCSKDGGENWTSKRLLQEGYAGYSDLTILPDGSIACVYDAGVNGPTDYIEFARFPAKWFP